MDEVGHLIAQFRAEDITQVRDSSNKIALLRQLEQHYGDDQRVLPFLLEVLSDTQEYDLARIEALKFFELKEEEDEDIGRQVGQAIKHILAHDPDDEVRNYAAMAASSYVGVNGIVGELEKVIFNPEEDVNIRWSAFAAIEEMGPTNQSKRIMVKALQDEEFKEYTARVLDIWQSG